MIHHTNCGLEGVTDAEIAAKTGAAGIDFLAFGDVEASVRDDLDEIGRKAALPAGFTFWGAVYDVDTGSLRVVVEPYQL